MRVIIIFVIIALMLLVGVILMLRAGKLKEKYAVLWLIIGVVCVVLAAWPELLAAAARLVGIQVASNLLFALAILLLLGICLQLSMEVSAQEDKVRRLAEEAAIAREQLERAEARLAAGGGDDESAGPSDDPGPVSARD